MKVNEKANCLNYLVSKAAFRLVFPTFWQQFYSCFVFANKTKNQNRTGEVQVWIWTHWKEYSGVKSTPDLWKVLFISRVYNKNKVNPIESFELVQNIHFTVIDLMSAQSCDARTNILVEDVSLWLNVWN